MGSVRKLIGYLCMLAAAVVAAAVVAAYLPKLMDYKKGQDLYNGLEEEHTSENTGEGIDDEMDTVMEDLTEADIEIAPIGGVSNKEKVDTFTVRDALKEAGIPEEKIEDFLPIKVDGYGLWSQNKDYIGWIYIPGTEISYPVVMSKDNKDYLHTNFAKEYNYPGSIFMDYRCKNSFTSHHSILYGHNMRDGSMFAHIKDYADQEFANEHPVFWFITPGYNLLYKVFSYYVSSPTDVVTFGADGQQFVNNKEWAEDVKKLEERSVVKPLTKTALNGKSYVMTLSTCTSERVTRGTLHGLFMGATKNQTFAEWARTKQAMEASSGETESELE